jgi:hypothetical protein
MHSSPDLKAYGCTFLLCDYLPELMKPLFVFCSLAALLSLSTNGSAAAEKVNLTGRAAPAFTATTVDGKPVSFPQSYKGKVVLLDFWAT